MKICNLDFKLRKIENSTSISIMHFNKNFDIIIYFYSFNSPDIRLISHDDQSNITIILHSSSSSFDNIISFHDEHKKILLNDFLNEYNEDKSLFQLSTIYNLSSILNLSEIVDLNNFINTVDNTQYDKVKEQLI